MNATKKQAKQSPPGILDSLLDVFQSEYDKSFDFEAAEGKRQNDTARAR